MKKRLDTVLFVVGVTLAIVLVFLIKVGGITSLVTFLSVMFVLVGGVSLGRWTKNENSTGAVCLRK